MDSDLLAPYFGSLLVACSGGADSLALAHLSVTHAKERGLPMPVLVYVDHGLRPESKMEGEAVVEFAEAAGAEGVVKQVEVASGASLEASARDARYRALRECAAEHRATWVLLGHTRSDQAETVLMRILRGTGIFGLAGMGITRGILARPLLGIPRSETETYCRRHGLAVAEDPMNRDMRFTRVRLRHALLPALREENPRLEEALCGLADSARDHREVLQWAGARVLSEHCQGGVLSLHADVTGLPDSLLARVLCEFAEAAGGGPLERRHISDLLAFARARTKGTRKISLPGVILVRSYDSLHSGDLDQEACSVRVEGDFHVRYWHPGDRMCPERLRGKSRKLSDLYADSKVPAAARRQSWVVVRGSEDEQTVEIVWAQHIGDAFGWNVGATLVPAGKNSSE